MSCTVQDIIDGKIPDEYLKKRNFFYHFIFQHTKSTMFLYPSLIDHFIKAREGNYRFFELAKAIRKSDKKVILKRAEDFDLKQINPKQMKAINFNVAAENGDLIQPIFTTISTHKKPEVYDIPEDVMAFFIHKSDYEPLKKFLDRTIIET